MIRLFVARVQVACLAASLTLMSLACIATIARAQAYVQNPLRLWDGSSEWTSRARNLGNAGYVSQALPHAVTGGLKKLTGVAMALQDENAATREPFNFGLCNVGATGAPDYANTQALLSGYHLPSGSGNLAWNVNLAFTSTTGSGVPVAWPQTGEEVHFVWQFVQPASWQADGISVHMSQAGPQLPSSRTVNVCHFWGGYGHSIQREAPRRDIGGQIVEELGWSQDTPVPVWVDRAWQLDLAFDEPVLQGGFLNAPYNTPDAANRCFDPNLGYGALDPDFSDAGRSIPARFDDYAWTVRAGGRFDGGFAVMFWSTTMLPQGVPTPFGELHLNPLDVLFALGPQLMGVISGGQVSASLRLGAGSAPARAIAASLPSFSAQALAVDATFTGRLSSVWTARPALAPGSWRRDLVDHTGKVLPKPSAQTLLQIRNDGHAMLTVEQRTGTTVLGPPVTVPVRAAVAIALAAAADNIEVRSRATRLQGFAYDL